MKPISIRSLAALAVLLAAPMVHAQTGNMAVNNDGRRPHPSAILDVSSNYLPLATAEQKGMLIPRMTQAQRNAIAPGAAQQGILIYQTDNQPGSPPGFYYWEYNTWVRVDAGSRGWDINGNNPVNVTNEFLGTRDNVDFVFRTNNVEAMRVKGTNGARYVGIGTTAPAEMVDVSADIQPALGAAIRIFNPSPGTWPGPLSFAVTNGPGTILFRPTGTGSPGDTLFSAWNTFSGVQNRDALMWAGHWGNINGTALQPVGLNAPDANTGGWRKLENDYQERFSVGFSQPSPQVCQLNSFSELPQGSTLHSNGLPAATALLMNPFKYDLGIPNTRRYRNQYMFLASELNLELNQVNGNLNATQGLCAGQPINSIAFWVNQAILATQARALQISVTVKHAPFGVNDLNGGFDNSIDPAQGCFNSAAFPLPAASAVAAWSNINLTSAFVWDGVRNIIVEIAVGTCPTNGNIFAGGLPVRYSTTATNLTYGSYAQGLPAGCTPASGLAGSCGPLNPATNLSSTCGTFGATNVRPVIRFGGTVSSAPPAITGQGSYLYYQGGLVVESTTTGTPFGRQTTPYYAFKGPGTVTAERGVFDNGVRLNDHVFDRAFDGRVAPQDAETFGTWRHHSIEEMAEFTAMNRHLPTVRGRESWKREGGFSLGDLTNQLWATAETQALYLTELHDRLNVLEVLSTDRSLSPEERELARKQVAAMDHLTDGEKQALIASISVRTVNTQQR
jgi:hypothetical protein